MQPARLDRAEPVTILAAVLLPPLGVFCAFGPGKDFAIACAMTVAGFLPGMGFALIRVLGPKNRRITSIPTDRDEPPQSP